MKKLLNLTSFIAILLTFMLSIQAYSQNSSQVIKFGVPKIDGDTTDWVGYDWIPFLYPATSFSSSDLSPRFKMSWDRSRMYLLFDVVDDILNTSNNDTWMRDGMEIACVFENQSIFKILVWCGASMSELISNSQTAIDADNAVGMEIATDTTDYGYILELALPFETFIFTPTTFEPSDGNKFQFEIWVNDSDDGTDRDRTSWADCSSINYNASEYDTIILSAVTSPKDIEIDHTTTPITIDGDFGEWNELYKNIIQNPLSGKVNSLQDLSGGLKALWDEENLYLFVSVFDSSATFHAEDSLLWNNRDAVQIALNLEGDETYDINTTADDDEALIVIPYNADQTTIENFSKKVDSWNGFEFAIDDNYSEFEFETQLFLMGYAIECRIPFANIWPGFNATEGVSFDMEINLVDNDNGLNEQTAVMSWSGLTDIMNDLEGFGSITLKGSGSNSIHENITNDIYVFPNPATDLISIKGVVTQIELYDITGNKVKQLNSNNNTTTSINISDIPSGLYLLKVDDEVHKIIKE